MKHSTAWPALLIILLASVILTLSSSQSCFCQHEQPPHNPKYDTVRMGDTSFYFRNDTLFTNQGVSVYVGRKFIVGKGSGENGWYQFISFKSALAFPLLFLRDEEVNHLYQGDAEKRDKDKLRDILKPGQTLIVTQVRQVRTKEKFPHYILHLADGTSSLANKYVCEILGALWLRELRFAGQDTHGND